MKTLYLNNKLVKVYTDIDEMPIVNFQKYNKFLLIDSGIGSTVDDFDAHVTKVAKYIKANDSAKALQELQNMRQNLFMINSEISPKYMAFAALIHSINGERVTDLSDEGLKAILTSLKSIKHSWLVKFMLWLKKKVKVELETYFPADFISAKEKEAYSKIATRTLLELDTIINDIDNEKQIADIDLALLNMHKPNTFIGSESAEVLYDKQFESTCLMISQETSLDAKGMTVLQFYSAVNTIKKQAEMKAKSLKRNKRA